MTTQIKTVAKTTNKAKTHGTSKIAPKKDAAVKKFVQLFKTYPIVAALNMELLPARQLQVMRASLRGNCEMFMAKRRVMKIAFEQIKNEVKGIEQLVPHLKGMPALLFTSQNPFKLYKTLEKSKSSAPAKAGQTAPKDIVVKAGATSFAPGPIIGELGQIGIKAGIENGKVSIKQDSVVVKEGAVISDKVAALLTRLGIEPMEIGLNLTALYEKGMIYTKDVLAVDEKEYVQKITDVSTSCFNLAIEIAYPCKDTIELLVQKTFNDSKAVALEANIMADAVVGDLLAKAEREAMSVKAEAKQ
ncbi:50S ribosomal protein L10 [Candidatus Woesearchaeota archaeon]|nr:50S ribosomal protein L10 [Candidatus Woesearchaeota archaeon]